MLSVLYSQECYVVYILNTKTTEDTKNKKLKHTCLNQSQHAFRLSKYYMTLCMLTKGSTILINSFKKVNTSQNSKFCRLVKKNLTAVEI